MKSNFGHIAHHLITGSDPVSGQMAQMTPEADGGGDTFFTEANPYAMQEPGGLFNSLLALVGSWGGTPDETMITDPDTVPEGAFIAPPAIELPEGVDYIPDETEVTDPDTVPEGAFIDKAAIELPEGIDYIPDETEVTDPDTVPEGAFIDKPVIELPEGIDYIPDETEVTDPDTMSVSTVIDGGNFASFFDDSDDGGDEGLNELLTLLESWGIEPDETMVTDPDSIPEGAMADGGEFQFMFDKDVNVVEYDPSKPDDDMLASDMDDHDAASESLMF